MLYIEYVYDKPDFRHWKDQHWGYSSMMHTLMITGCAVPSVCVNGDWLCQWYMPSFDPQENQPP